MGAYRLIPPKSAQNVTNWYNLIKLGNYSVIITYKIYQCNNLNAWVSVLLPALFCFHRLCYKQLSKNNQNIRNPIPFWCKIKSPQQNCTKQKRGGFPVVNFTSNTYQMKRETQVYVISS